MTVRRWFLIFAVVAPTVLGALAYRWHIVAWVLAPVLAIVAIGTIDSIQTRHSILRLYPVVGHLRFLAERIRPEVQQYFIETNTNGTPFSRETREIVYQRSKGQRDNLPFGTQLDVYQPGHEFLHHSITPRKPREVDPRVVIGGPDCTQPYSSSHLNVSGMSFGALSEAAIRALNRGAAIGGFAHNTGEGGVSPYHLFGADLIWQIGTGYFGCRTPGGEFDRAMFADAAAEPAIKAIEIKISQGAKPGHGGILPKTKLTPEIAEIRGVPLGVDVISPPAHSAFESPEELVDFIADMRSLAEGKPVGIKFCLGQVGELDRLITVMSDSGITPDFITIDGAEGGTGAAPPELVDHVGMPLRDALSITHQHLQASGLRPHIRLIAAGKIATGLDMVRALALGADLCYSARAMMLSLGCIQARRCHTNDCPVGIATQDPARSRALVVGDKAQRVARFHTETIANFLELVAVTGCDHPRELGLAHLSRRSPDGTVSSYEEIYTLLDLAPPALATAQERARQEAEIEGSAVRPGRGGPDEPDPLATLTTAP